YNPLETCALEWKVFSKASGFAPQYHQGNREDYVAVRKLKPSAGIEGCVFLQDGRKKRFPGCPKASTIAPAGGKILFFFPSEKEKIWREDGKMELLEARRFASNRNGLLLRERFLLLYRKVLII
ncbi:hypothetical protein J2X31_000553, partial [Flavobacterium arsenatis]